MANEPNSMWEKSSLELVAFFEELAPKAAGVSKKKMFGWPCCFVNGNLFMGLHRQSMLFRLSDADRSAFLNLDSAADFEPMPGRKMKGYVVMADPLRCDRGELEAWVMRSLEFARGLPAKPKSAAVTKKPKKAKA